MESASIKFVLRNKESKSVSKKDSFYTALLFFKVTRIRFHWAPFCEPCVSIWELILQYKFSNKGTKASALSKSAPPFFGMNDVYNTRNNKKLK